MPTSTIIGNCCNCGEADCDACPDVDTLHLDFEGTDIALEWTGSAWIGTGSPGDCASVWEFTVTCTSAPDPVWTLFIENPESAECVTVGTYQGERVSCDPLEVEFEVEVSQPPMASCCLGGTFPRTIPALLTL